MNKNTKRRLAAKHSEIVESRKWRHEGTTLFQGVSSEKAMIQEVAHNIGPDGKRVSITRYIPFVAPGVKRRVPYSRTFKAMQTDL
jgi:hypothetical protein